MDENIQTTEATIYSAHNGNATIFTSLPPFAFYKHPDATLDNLIRDEFDIINGLQDRTAYFICSDPDFTNINVQKRDVDAPYELTQSVDDPKKWAVTFAENGEGGVEVALTITAQYRDEPFEDDFDWYFYYPAPPQLYVRYLDGGWDDDFRQDFLYENPDQWIGDGMGIYPGQKHSVIFYIPKNKIDWNDEESWKNPGNWEPVSVDDLECDDSGVTIEQIYPDGYPEEHPDWVQNTDNSACFVEVSVKDWDGDYQISCEKNGVTYTLGIDSHLQDAEFYTQPTPDKEYVIYDENGNNIRELENNTAYFISTWSSNPNDRRVVQLIKEDPWDNRYTVEWYDTETKEDGSGANIWKIIFNVNDGEHVDVNLQAVFEERKGWTDVIETYTEGRGRHFYYAGEPGGPELWVRWLDRDGNGFWEQTDQWGNPLRDQLRFDMRNIPPFDEPCVIFYARVGDEEFIPVPFDKLVLEWDGDEEESSFHIEKLRSDEIRKDQEHRDCFVRVKTDGWNKKCRVSYTRPGENGDNPCTYTITIDSYPYCVNFYNSVDISNGNISNGDMSRLAEKRTAYLIYNPAYPQDDGRVLEAVYKRNSNDDSFNLEQIDDTTWKVTFKYDDVDVNLNLLYRNRDDDRFVEPWGQHFYTPDYPRLGVRWLDRNWIEDENDGRNVVWEDRYRNIDYGMRIYPETEAQLIFYYRDFDDAGRDIFTTPVPYDQLNPGPGVEITPINGNEIAEGQGNENCFVRVSVADWNQEYTISANRGDGDTYTMRFDSCLNELDWYTAPEAKPENVVYDWWYTPFQENSEVYLISTATDRENGRHLVSARLTAPDRTNNNDQFTLKCINSNTYRLTRGTTDAGNLRAEILLTWFGRDERGNWHTYTEPIDIWSNPRWATVVKEDVPIRLDKLFTDEENANVSTTLELEAGIEKEIYLSWIHWDNCPIGGGPEEEPIWSDWHWHFHPCDAFGTSSEALRLTSDNPEGDITKFRVVCDEPGEYSLWLGAPNDWLPVRVTVKGLELSDSEITLTPGAKRTLTVAAGNGGADSPAFQWKSTDESVAKVDANGTVTAISPGDAEIKVSAPGYGKELTCAVHVTGVQANDYEITGLNVTKAGSPYAGYWATVTISKHQEAGDVLLLLVGYDANGKYLDTFYARAKEMDVGKSVELSFLLRDANIKKVKAILIPTLADPMPLSPEKEAAVR